MPKVKLIDPMTVCNLGSTESYTDGVHLTRPEYEKLAKVVIELVAGQPQEDLQQNPANSQLAKRPRLSTGGQQLGVVRGGGERERRQGPLSWQQGLLVGDNWYEKNKVKNIISYTAMEQQQ